MLIVYTKNNCIQCKITKKRLQRLNIQFIEENVENNDELLQEIKRAGFMSMPVLKENDMFITSVQQYLNEKEDKFR